MNEFFKNNYCAQRIEYVIEFFAFSKIRPGRIELKSGGFFCYLRENRNVNVSKILYIKINLILRHVLSF